MLNLLKVFLCSLLPVIEIRGAIILARSYNLDPTISFLVCFIGNLLPVPFIYFFAQKVLLWGKDKKYIGSFFTYCLQKGKQLGQKLEKKSKNGIFMALLTFVAVPLPGTGAWTATLAASILNLNFKKTLISTAIGIIIAGLIVNNVFSILIRLLHL